MFNKNLNPFILVGFSLFGGILLLSALHQSSKEVFPRLHNSLVFQSIIECTDVVDGVSCFKQHKSDLIREIRMQTTQAQTQWELCLDVLGETGDINLLLNIQKCYHQADIIDRDTHSDTTFSMVGITVSLMIQLFLALYFLLGQLMRKRNQDEQRETVAKLREIGNNNAEAMSKLNDELKELKAAHNSNIKNILGRLTKGGDIKSDIDRVKSYFYGLNEDLNQLKIEYFTRMGNDVMIVPPPTSDIYSQMPPVYPISAPNYPGYYPLSGASGPKKKKGKANDGSQINSKSRGLIRSPERLEYTSNYKDKNLDSQENSVSKLEETQVPVKQQDLKVSNPKRPSFNILTPEGRDQMKNFMQEKVRYRDLVKEENGKPFKRIMIPNRGWVSARKLREEEALLGADSFVQL